MKHVEGIITMLYGLIYLIAVTLAITYLTGYNAMDMIFWIIYTPFAVLNIYEQSKK